MKGGKLLTSTSYVAHVDETTGVTCPVTLVYLTGLGGGKGDPAVGVAVTHDGCSRHEQLSNFLPAQVEPVSRRRSEANTMRVLVRSDNRDIR